MRAGPHLAIDIGTLACQQGIPVRFFTASGLIMRLRKAKTDNRLDQELKTIGKADLLVIDELGYLPIDIDGARLLSPDHRGQLRKEKHHPPPRTRVRPMVRRVRRPRSWPPPSSTASTRHGRIIRFHGESHPEHPLTHEITRHPRTKETNRPYRPT
ncbi:ATP-binding protein [Bifidobacterium pullorum]|uniref:ATP-binding protein n=1 Tax=Bifidobacterium pullorum TaxID=78448 RepID=UPI0029CA7664|nr:ATP-binding protein [Bifidobacterium pullorum]